MFVIEYLFFLGIAWLVFWAVNLILGLLASIVITITRFRKLAYVTAPLSAYIFVSLVVLVTLGSIQLNPNTAATIVLPIIGGIIVFTTLGNSAAERKKNAIQDYDYEGLPLMRYDGVIVIGLTALFIVMLFLPFIAGNPLTMRLLALIDWAYDVKVLGWILRIGGALFLIACAFQGFLYSLMLFGGIISAFRNDGEEPNWFQRHLNWTWVLAYLVWLPLNASDSLAPHIIGAVILLIVSVWVIRQKGRRLWWILLSPVFSPLWLKNKRRVHALPETETAKL